jgi:hypothetical protein
MGWGVVWNVTTPYFVVQEPPGAHNWCIGCIGQELNATEAGSGVPVPNGIYESTGVKVTPNSLYLAQLCDRLGPRAVASIGVPGCLRRGRIRPVGLQALFRFAAHADRHSDKIEGISR